MQGALPPVFWIKLGLTIVSAMFLALTVIWPQWIERFLAMEPDGGDGSSEWGITLSLVVTTVALSVLSGHAWRKARG